MAYNDYYMDADGFGAECPDNWEIHAEIINKHIDELIAELPAFDTLSEHERICVYHDENNYIHECACEPVWEAYCGCQYDEEIAELTREAAERIAGWIRSESEWNFEWLEKLCCMAEMRDAWNDADDDNFEDVAREAAKRLGVEID